MKSLLYPGKKVIVERSHDIVQKGQVFIVEKVKVYSDASYGFTIKGRDPDYFHAFDYRWGLVKES